MTDEDVRASAVASAIQLVAGMYHDIPSEQVHLSRIASAIHAIILLIKTGNFYGYIVGMTDDLSNPSIPPIQYLAPQKTKDSSGKTADAHGG